MIWKTLLACFAVLCLTSFCWHNSVPVEKTYRVPRLQGPDVYLKESELDRLTSFNWAMMLDIVNDKATKEAFARQCQKDPTLAEKVDNHFAAKVMIESAKRRRR